MKLFTSNDSRYTLKTACLVTLVPCVLLSLIVYSVWLLLALNHSYFIANGFPVDEVTRENFLTFLLQSQMEYWPYIGLYFISVFFIGIFLAHVVLRPFNQLRDMCEGIVAGNETKMNLTGLNNRKLLIKLGYFLTEYASARKEGKMISVPREFEKVKGPAMDWVYYFQFISLIAILMAVTVTTINVFTNQLHEEIIQTAVTMLKAPQGMSTFLASQNDVFDLIILAPSIMACLFYGIIGRLIISRIEGVTYAYLRDVREMACGNYAKRIDPRSEDPGKHTAKAVNDLLDHIHPAYKKETRVEVKTAIGLMPGGAKT